MWSSVPLPALCLVDIFDFTLAFALHMELFQFFYSTFSSKRIIEPVIVILN